MMVVLLPLIGLAGHMACHMAGHMAGDLSRGEREGAAAPSLEQGGSGGAAKPPRGEVHALISGGVPPSMERPQVEVP